MNKYFHYFCIAGKCIYLNHPCWVWISNTPPLDRAWETVKWIGVGGGIWNIPLFSVFHYDCLKLDWSKWGKVNFKLLNLKKLKNLPWTKTIFDSDFFNLIMSLQQFQSFCSALYIVRCIKPAEGEPVFIPMSRAFSTNGNLCLPWCYIP